VADAGTPGLAARLSADRPALVLLDLNLAGRSGADALAELRASDAFAGVAVLAFTAGASSGTPRGFDGRLTKPVEPEALVAAVDGALETRAASGVPDREPEPEPDDFLAPLRARFRTGLAGRLLAIEAARMEGEHETLLRELHKLRGAAAGYGFDALAEAAAGAEEAMRGGGGEAEVAHLSRLLRDVVGAG
jgi:HPt (histidine-containing phosphotransfer) domain-containing protein